MAVVLNSFKRSFGELFFFFFNWRLRSLSSMGLVIFRCYVEDEYVNPVWKAEITELMQHLVRKSYP